MNVPIRDVTASQRFAAVDCDIHPVQRAKSYLAPLMYDDSREFASRHFRISLA